MNKYQDALDRLKHINLDLILEKLGHEVADEVSDYGMCDYPNLEMSYDIEAIQELVDRATPVAIEMRNDGFHCPNCGAKIQSRLFYTFFCNECGQAFDGGMNEKIEFNFSYKGESHHIVVSYAYGSNDGYYWDKQYFIIIDNKPYIFLVIGSWSGWIEKNNSLKQVDFDYLKDRKKENTSNFCNDVSVSDFKNDRETFEKLYKFMLDNDAKEVLEDDDNLKVIER